MATVLSKKLKYVPMFNKEEMEMEKLNYDNPLLFTHIASATYIL